MSDQPALTVTPVHPYATEVTVIENGRRPVITTLPAVLPLIGRPGRRDLTVATTTAYGTLPPHPVVYRRA